MAKRRQKGTVRGRAKKQIDRCSKLQSAISSSLTKVEIAKLSKRDLAHIERCHKCRLYWAEARADYRVMTQGFPAERREEAIAAMLGSS
jgi:hypothetical protein